MKSSAGSGGPAPGRGHLAAGGLAGLEGVGEGDRGGLAGGGWGLVMEGGGQGLERRCVSRIQEAGSVSPSPRVAGSLAGESWLGLSGILESPGQGWEGSSGTTQEEREGSLERRKLWTMEGGGLFSILSTSSVQAKGSEGGW